MRDTRKATNPIARRVSTNDIQWRILAAPRHARDGRTMGILDDLLGGLAGQGTPGPAANSPSRLPGGLDSRTLMLLLPVVLSMLGQRGRGSQAPGGGLGDVLGQALGTGAATRSGGGLGDLLGQVLAGGGALSPGSGGLGGLLDAFRSAGLGQHADSWVGKGQNLPMPSGALEQLLGRGGLAQIAQHAGISEGDAARGLSALLPDVVDRVTPDGRVPDSDALTAGIQGLARQFGLR
jgi:uncharacterized protein YidB (DUF937 family)